MIASKSKRRQEVLKKRQVRIRKKIVGTPERPRLAVKRSIKHMVAQLIDDVNNRSLLQVSTRSIKEKVSKCEQSKNLGKLMGEKAMSLGIKQVVFDRGGFLYHGRVKAVSDGAREAGLQF